MKTLNLLVKRNMKLYFKDKGMFFVSLITPVILLVLYLTFLGNVFRDGFTSNLPEGMEFEKRVLEGLVGGQLMSSILAACTVTISFCSNFVMIQDKYTDSIKDLTIAPINKNILGLSYFIASFSATLSICYITVILGFIYLAIVGWYLTAVDVIYILLDVFLLVLFGTAFSSIMHFFLTTQGQASAVGTIVSSLYGFVCGAYMPMSQFPEGLRNFLSLLPGTYGTVLLRNHYMDCIIDDLEYPNEVITAIKDSVDCNIYCFGNNVEIPYMYLILCSAIIVFIGLYLLFNVKAKNQFKK